MRVTIWDVAREAQTSKSTVSKVLRGERRVGRETRARVQEAIAALGYRPNAAARSLVRRRAQALGIVVADLRNPFFAEIAHGITEVARASGYATVLTDLQGATPGGDDLLDLALEGRADGLILAAWPAAGEPARRLAATGIPLAFVSCRPLGLSADFVVIDEQRGAELAVGHLVELGHRRIGYIGNADDDSSAMERIAGYRAGLAAASLPFDPALVVTAEAIDSGSDFGSLAGHKAAHTLMGIAPRPTAIFAADDFIALGAMQALEEDGLMVPRDVSLVGFDDIAFAGLSRIGLTTIAQPTALMGRRVAELLLARLGGAGPDTAAEAPSARQTASARQALSAPQAPSATQAPPAPVEIVLEPRLVVRSSTAPPRVD